MTDTTATLIGEVHELRLANEMLAQLSSDQSFEAQGLRTEVERLRSIDMQQVAAVVLAEYGMCAEDVFHAATLIAERFAAAVNS